MAELCAIIEREAPGRRRRRPTAHAPWRARRAGGRDRGVHRPTAQPMQHPDPDRGRAPDDVDSATDAYDIPAGAARRATTRRRRRCSCRPSWTAARRGEARPAPARADRRSRLPRRARRSRHGPTRSSTAFLGSAPPSGRASRSGSPRARPSSTSATSSTRAGVVGNGRVWALNVRLHGDGGDLRAGTYRLRQNEHYARSSRRSTAGRRRWPARALPRSPRASRSATSRRRAPRLGISPSAYRAAVRTRRRRRATARRARSGSASRASCSPRPTRSRSRSGDAPRAQQLAAFERASRSVDFRGGAEEPHALRRAHHRLDDRARGRLSAATAPRSRP